MYVVAGAAAPWLGAPLTRAVRHSLTRQVILFTGGISSYYLGRRQWPFHWLAMVIISVGMLLVTATATHSALL